MAFAVKNCQLKSVVEQRYHLVGSEESNSLNLLIAQFLIHFKFVNLSFYKALIYLKIITSFINQIYNMFRIISTLFLVYLSFSQYFYIPQRYLIQRNRCTMLHIDIKNVLGNLSIFFIQSDKITTNPVSASLNQSGLKYSTSLYRFRVKVCTHNLTTEQSVTLGYLIDDALNKRAYELPDGFVALDIEEPFGRPKRILKIQRIRIDGRCVNIDIFYPGQPIPTLRLYSAIRQNEKDVQLNFTKDPWWLFQIKAVQTNLSLQDRFRFPNLSSRSLLKQIVADSFHFYSQLQNKWTVTYSLVYEESVYNICLFYWDEDKNQESNTICRKVETNGNPIIRFQLNFTKQINAPQLNQLLCFLSGYFKIPLQDLSTVNGLSCNPQSKKPRNYYYPSSDPMPNILNTIIYVTRHCQQRYNVSLVQLQQGLSNMFGLKKQGLTNFGRQIFYKYRFKWIQNGQYLGQKQVSQMIKVEPGHFNYKIIASIDQVQNNINQNTQNVLILIIKSSFQGVLYFLLLGQINNFLLTPEIIVGGFMGNKKIGQSFHIPMLKMSPQSITVEIPLAASNETRKIYYVASSDYPKFPIIEKKYHELNIEIMSSNERQKSASQLKKFLPNTNNKTIQQKKIDVNMKGYPILHILATLHLIGFTLIL